MICDVLNALYGESWVIHYTNSANVPSVFPVGRVMVAVLLLVAVIVAIGYNLTASRQGDTINLDEVADVVAEAERLSANNSILSQVQLSTNKICSSKYDTLLTEIREIENGAKYYPSKIISNPAKQLKAIISQMLECIASISDLQENQLRIHVAYKFKNGKWHWIDGYASQGFFSIENLSADENTTFSHVTRTDAHREDFIFFNKKSVAVRNSKYVYEPHRDFDGATLTDPNELNDGSILAKSIFIGDRSTEVFAELVIFIDTTDGLFILKDDSRAKYAKQQFKDKIFSVYEERLKIELALLYLDNLKKINDLEQPEDNVS